ncbi:HEPN domain-containing protein [Candidatus Woesearchaeota archaeon]|nr:HEPN domain-containing protein [Candidatus Woesearchaeota archaeon]
MRQEISNWWEQAKEDFDAAEYNFEGGKFYLAAFMCQQAVEKSLKALFLLEKKGIVPQSHSLIYLASNTTTPKKFYSFLKELTPKFIDTRYPDASVDLPSRIYDKNNTEKIVKGSKEVMKWAETKLK